MLGNNRKTAYVKTAALIIFLSMSGLVLGAEPESLLDPAVEAAVETISTETASEPHLARRTWN